MPRGVGRPLLHHDVKEHDVLRPGPDAPLASAAQIARTRSTSTGETEGGRSERPVTTISGATTIRCSRRARAPSIKVTRTVAPSGPGARVTCAA